ncbi:MAG TPA: ABC transporter ATP-binding protein [Polyangiaceae bacterium]|nr:ABC transporter ATP-binding protein [Polyangiaceae bacterium]
MTESAPLLEVTDLQTHFHTEEGTLRAVDGVSFRLDRGRTLALVGESGCGKSVTARSLLRLIPAPGRIVGGSIRLHGGDDPPLDVLEEREDSAALRNLRGGRAALIFQQAAAAASPVHTIGEQLLEAIRGHQKIGKMGARQIALEMLERVGVEDPELCLRRYPHELSASLRQRAMIALALVSQPELLIADEPTAALDVTSQAQVLILLKELQKKHGLALLLISHDLGVVAQMADEVAVMYLGRVVEAGPVRTILKRPRHPYTIGLLEALSGLTPLGKRLPGLRGSVPALSDLPPGCAFHPRCNYAVPGRCNVGSPPPLERFAGQGAGEDRSAACWRTREVALERLLHRPTAGGPASTPSLTPAAPSEPAPPASTAALEDPTERVTETAAPPFVAPRAPGPADTQAEAEWFDSKDFESVREGPGGDEEPAP